MYDAGLTARPSRSSKSWMTSAMVEDRRKRCKALSLSRPDEMKSWIVIDFLSHLRHRNGALRGGREKGRARCSPVFSMLSA